MDGINPTLAFAVLLFGMSSNARDANELPPQAALESGSGCPILVITSNPAPATYLEDWTEAFWNSAAAVSVLPDVIEPKWADAEAPETEGQEPIDAIAVSAFDYGSDPINRRAVATSTSAPAIGSEHDPCSP